HGLFAGVGRRTGEGSERARSGRACGTKEELRARLEMQQQRGDGMLKMLKCAARAAMACTVLLAMANAMRADEPFARNKDYDLQHSKIALKFDLEQKRVIGDVTHTLTILKEGTDRIWYDSVGLTIQSVTVDKAAAKFESKERRL